MRVLLLVLCLGLAKAEEYLVKTEQGTVSGHLLKSLRKERDIFAFNGIPYAAPPLGELRFKDPEGVKSWDGVLETKTEGEDCMQRDMLFNSAPFQGLDMNPDRIVGSEDCLYLNVYTPDLKPSEGLLPVMFFIHGGGFEIGSGSRMLAGPELLLDRDIVLVTFNYRLGPLGFLSLENESLRGNMGLKDQAAALRWTRQNIGAFGGDPASITIFGESAGAASVHLHMSSSLSSSLFERAISQSGNRDCLWAVGVEGQVRNNTLKLGEALECPLKSDLDLLTCLRALPPQQIVKALSIIQDRPMTMGFRPVGEVEGEGAYLTKADLERPTTKPWMTGVNSGEGLIIYDQHCLQKDNELVGLNAYYKEILPNELFYSGRVRDRDAFTETLKQFYIGTKPFDLNSFGDIIEMFSDGMFVYPHHKAVSEHKGKVYQYHFTHRAQRSFSTFTGNKDTKLANHADDLPNLFYLKKFFPNINYNAKDEEVSELLLDLWTNFATFGEPTPEGYHLRWEEGSSRYLKISSKGGSTKGDLHHKRMTFWRSLLQQHSQTPSTTTTVHTEL